MDKIECLKNALEGIEDCCLAVEDKAKMRLQFIAPHFDYQNLVNVHAIRRLGINISDAEFAALLLHRAAKKGLRPKAELIPKL